MLNIQGRSFLIFGREREREKKSGRGQGRREERLSPVEHVESRKRALQTKTKNY